MGADSDLATGDDPHQHKHFGGAVGAGIVLVLMPSVALYLGVEWIEKRPSVGLPLLAIFGIMILFGALSLVSTLFARLKLEDRSQALALPEGSIRAAIALALIVLFAIIAIMLFEKTSGTYELKGLTAIQKDALINNPAYSIVAIVEASCAPPAECKPASFNVHLARKPAQESSDLAKQLLILIGTLMTSVTSFYFGSRTANPASPMTREPQMAGPPPEDGDISTVPLAARDTTPDEALPPATGGVA
ncbi:MAG TPA: hypothetical protein VGD52_01710 [Pseudoduganella sp.]